MELYKNTYEVSDVFKEYFGQYLQQFGPLPKHHYNVANVIMQKLFRGKFMDYFKKAVSLGKINPMFVATPEFPSFKNLINKLYSLKWVIYVKKPFKDVENLVKYQARYINRFAISNNRILDFSNGKVTFSYKDYADKDINKTMTISAVEFIRRFMLHILPSGFMRIRQYGFLNASKKKSLEIIRALIFESDGKKQKTREKNNSVNNTEKQIQCPLCKKGIMIKGREIIPVRNRFTTVVND